MILELRIFPPNFHLLTGILKTGLTLVNGGAGGGFQSGQALHTQFRQDFEEYVSSVPGYCLKSMMVLLNRYGLAKIVQSNNPLLQEQMQYKLHSRPYNRLQKWARLARKSRRISRDSSETDYHEQPHWTLGHWLWHVAHMHASNSQLARTVDLCRRLW